MTARDAAEERRAAAVEPHQEAESDHLRHRRLDAAHQSQGGHQSRDAGRQNRASRRDTRDE